MSDWFAVIDAAQDDRLHPLIERCAERACLLSGKLDPVLAAAAPYLVAIRESEPLIGIWRAHGSNRNWGLLCESALPLESLRQHFRRFLQAVLPDGAVAQFRFYDPRVFIAYLPTLSADQLAPWFEGVDQYAVEGPGDRAHSFRLRQGRLFDGDAPVGGG